MSTFPGAIPSYSVMNPNDTLAAAGHTARHNEVQLDVAAIATKLGTGAATPSAGKVLKGNGAGSSTWGAVDLTADVTNKLPVGNIDMLAVLGAVYPIGSIYTSVVSTNPNTLFGVGTWAAFGQGQVMVGFDSGQTEFNASEKAGGEKTHALSVAEMPSHTHVATVTDPTHSHRQIVTANTGTDAIRRDFQSDGGAAAFDQGVNTFPASTGVTVGNANTGGGGAHNNLQPYVTVYMWKRTA